MIRRRGAAVAPAHAPGQESRVHLIENGDARRGRPLFIERRTGLDVETGVAEPIRRAPHGRADEDEGADERDRVPARAREQRRQERQHAERGDHARCRETVEEGHGEQRARRGAGQIGGGHARDLPAARAQQEHADGRAERQHRHEDQRNPEEQIATPRRAQMHDRQHGAGKRDRACVKRDEQRGRTRRRQREPHPGGREAEHRQ